MVSPASSASEWQDMLSGRLPMREVRAWGKRLAHDGMFRDTLHHIMTDGDSRMAENAAWVFTYADADVLPSLPSHYVDTWMERVMNTRSETLRRLLLTLISRSTLPHPFRTDFLDYCLAGMSSSRYPHSVRALCMKLAYKLCRTHPELLEELKLKSWNRTFFRPHCAACAAVSWLVLLPKSADKATDKMSVLYGQESRICIPFGVLWISNDSRASVFY